MAYRLKLNEPLDRGFRRIATAQISRAITHVEAATEVTSIHETRKCLKRTRALLRFYRPALAEASFKTFNASLRSIGQTLSIRRDTDVLMQTVTSLVQSAGLKRASAAQLHKAILKFRETQTNPTGHAPDTHAIIADLLSVREALAAVVCETDDETLITSGMARSLDTAHETFEAAFEDSQDEALHEWRKAVQIHWRHMQLVSAAWPAYCDARIEEARTISALVGAYRDLSSLSDHINGNQRDTGTRALVLKPALQRTVTDLIEAHKKPFHIKAKLHGERLLAEGTSGLCRRLMVYWATAAELKGIDAAISDSKSSN